MVNCTRAGSFKVRTEHNQRTLDFVIVRKDENYGFMLEVNDDTIHWCGRCDTVTELQKKAKEFARKNDGHLVDFWTSPEGPVI